MKKEELSIKEIFSLLKGNLRTILVYGTVTVIIGLVFHMTTPKVWSSKVALLPEFGSEGLELGGGLSGLAGLAGINLNGGGGGELSPQVYPEILESTSLYLNILNEEYYFSNIDKTVSSYQYFDEYRDKSILEWCKDYVLRTKRRVFGVKELNRMNDHSLIMIDEYENDAIKYYKKAVGISLNYESGVVTITATSQDPEVSALLVDYIREYFSDFIITYKTQREKEKCDFIEKQYFQKKAELDSALKALSVYMDENVSLSSERSKIELKKLQTDYDLAFNVFNTLAQQYEEAKIKIEEQTPVFKVLTPIVVPIETSNLSMMIVLIISFIAGIFIGVIRIVLPFILT